MLEDLRSGQASAESKHVGLIKIKSGVAIAERVDQELKNMIDGKWQWG